MNKVTSYLKNVGKSLAYATVDASKNVVPEVSDFIDTNKDVLKSIYSTVRHAKTSVNYAKKLAADNRIYKDINKGIDNVFSDIKTGNFYNKEREQEYIDKTAESWLGDFDDDFDFNFDDDDNSLDEFQDKPEESSDKSNLIVVDSVVRSSNLSSQLISKTVANTSKSIMTTQINSTNMIIAQNAELMAGLRTSVQGIHESVNQILRFNAEQVTTQINNESQFFESTTGILKENNSILKEILDIQKSIYKNNDSESGYSSDPISNIFNGTTVDLKEYIKVIGKNLKNLDNTGMIDMLTSSTGDQSMLGSFLSNPLGMIMTGIVEKAMPRNAVKSISNFSKSLGALFPAMISKLNKSKNMGSIGGLLGSILGVNIETKKRIDTGKYNKGAVPFDGITRKAIVDVIPEHLARIESLISGKSQRIYDYNSGKWTTNDEIKKKQEEEEGYYIKNSYGELTSTINNFISNLQKEKILSYQDKQNFNEDIIELMRPFFEQGVAFSSADARKEKNKKNSKYKFKNAEMIDALLDVMDKESPYKQISTASDIFYNKKRYADFLRDEERKGDSLSRKVFDNSMKDNDSVNGILSLLQGSSSINSSTENINYTKASNKYSTNKDEKKFNDFYYNPAADVNKGLKNAISDTVKKSAEKENEDYKKYGGFFNSKIWQSTVDKIPGDSFIKKSLRNPGTLIAGLVESADKSIYNFLFDTDTGIVDPETNENIKGIFNSMLNGMKDSWTSLTESIDKRILEPLEEKFGLKTKVKNAVNKLVGTVQKDEKGNIIKNEYGFASRSGGKFTNTLTALQRKYRTGQKFVKDSIIDVFIRDPQVAMLESDLNNGRYDLNNIDDIIALQNIINGFTKEQKKKISKSLKEKLVEYGIAGFARGGKAKLRKRKHKHKNKSGKVVKPGIIEVSEGEEVTVNSNDTENKQEQNEQKESNRAFDYLKHSALGKSVEDLKAKIKENKTANGAYDKIKAIFSDMKDKGSELGADSIIGGGAGLLVGGPVLGALLGASVSIIKNSQTAQKLMFGERSFDENGYITEQKGGLINKDIQNTFKKYVPDMGKYGIAGMASSLVLPFGPLGGAVLGAGVSLLKNSQTMNEMIFGKDIVDENGNVTGKDNSGLLTPARINKIKKGLPKAAAGAIGGMVLGPFGLLGNAALGAGVGLLTGTDEFKDLIFGKMGADGERYGGLKDALNEHFINPITEFGTNFKDDFFGFIKQEMIDPLNEAITPITNEIGYLAKRIVFWLPNTIAKLTKDSIATPLMAILNDKIISPIAGMTKGIFGKVFNFGKGVATLPFKAIRGLGNKATEKQIRRGNTVNMSAAQRLQFRETHNMGEDNFSKLDKDMVEMNQEQIEEYDSTLNAIDQGDKYFDKEMYKVRKRLGNTISKNLKEGHITGGVAGKIRKAIKDDDIDGALTLLSEAKKTRKGGKLSDEDYNSIATELKKGSEDYKTIKLRRDQFGEKQKTIANELNKKYGLNVNDEKTRKALINNFDEEARRAKARNDIEKSMEKPEDLVTKGDEGIIEQLKLLREDIKKIMSGEDVLSSGRQTELDNYKNKADKSINKNLSRRASNNAEISKKTGFNDADIIGLFAINKNLYNTVLKAQGKGVYFSTDNVRNLSKLNKQQLSVINKLPYLGLLDLNIMKKYTDKHRNANKSDILNTSIKSGVDINSLDEAAMVTDSNTNKQDHKKRAEYYNKLNQLGLVGDKISKQDILSRSGATYAQMDKLIKDQEKLNKLKDDENLDDVESKNSTNKGSFKEKVKTVFTEHGPISYLLNKRGEYKKLNSKQNKETQKEADRDNDERKGIISSLSGLKDSFLAFFGKKKDDKDSDKKSWWEKLLDNPVTNTVKKVATVGGILLGIGKLANAWESEGDDGIMHKLVNKFKDTFSPIITKVTDWFSNSGEYEDENKGLQGLLSNHIFPNLFKGINVVFGTILPAITKSFIKSLPVIIKSALEGVADLFGWNKNKQSKHKVSASKISTTSGVAISNIPSYLNETVTDSQSIATQIVNDSLEDSSSSSNASVDAISGADQSSSKSSKEIVNDAISGAAVQTKKAANNNTSVNSNDELLFENKYKMYTKDSDGNLIPLTAADATNGINDFYTETGAHYVYNNDIKNYESDTTTQHLNDGLVSRLGSVAARSALTGKTMGVMKVGKAAGAVGKALSKVPIIGTGAKLLTGIGNVVGSTSTYASKAPELLKYVGARTKAGMKTVDAVKDVASAAIGTTKVGQFAYKAANTVKNSSATKLVTGAANAVKNKVVSSKTGKKLAELGSKSKGAVKMVSEWIKNGLTKILNNSFIFNKIKDALAAAGKLTNATKEATEKATKKVVNEIIEKITNKFAGTKIGKFAEKATAKISSTISTVGIMTFAFSVTDFIVGFDQADSILGIEDTNIIQKLIAGLCNIINQELFFGFFDTADVLDFLVDIIFPIFNINMEGYKQQKQEADKSAQEYNDLNGTNYSTDEYLKKDSWTYKVSQGWDNVKNTVKNTVGGFINNINPFSKKDKKSTTNKANDAVSKVATETKKSISSTAKHFDTENINDAAGVAEAGNIAIGYQQANASSALSQNLTSANDYMDFKLGQSFGFTDSSGKTIPLSEGAAKYNKNSLNRKSKNQYTFADVLNNINEIFKAWANTTSEALKSTTNTTSSSSKLSSSKTKTNPFTAFFNKLTGRGTMNESGFVSQLDPKFKNKKFNTGKDSETQTLGDSGCAPATAANVLNLYAGKGTVMDDASNVALKYKDRNSGVTPDYFQSYLGSNGIGTYSTMNKNEMLSGISQGRPTVLLGSDPTNRAKTPYGSSSSHYVLATGLDGKGNVIIQDPESKRPNSLYPVRDVIKQTTLGMITGRGSLNAKDLNSKVKAKLGKVGFGRGSSTVNQDLAKWSPITEGELNSAIRRLAGSNRGFSGHGKYFIEAAEASGLDPRYILAHAALESAWGDSSYAKAGNFFGIGAFDSNPDNAYNYGNSSMESGLINGAKWIRKNFYDVGQTTLYKMRHNGGSHEYATDPDWDNKIARIMDQLPANSSASYHESNADSSSSSSDSSSSSGYSGLLNSLDDLVFSYYDDDSKNFIKSLFGLNDNSSSSDDSSDDSSSGSSSYSGDAKTAQEFYNKYNGVAVDYDNAYGAQCVDLFKQYSDDVLGLKNYVVPGDGGARNIATDSRLNPYYDKVSLNDAKYGDWVVWDGSHGGGWGHVAMYTGMDGNRIKAFGTNQGGPGGAANTIPVSSSGVLAVLRPKISGKGSGKVKSSASYQSLPSNMLNNYRRKSVSVPSISRPVNTGIHLSGTGTLSLPSLDYSATSGNYNTATSNYSTFGSPQSTVSNNSRVENLITVVIDVLRIIADNSSKLSEIVTLLSKALDVNLTNDDIQSLSSNNAQIKNKIANALKTQGSPNGMGSTIMNASTESLASALYTIARA